MTSQRAFQSRDIAAACDTARKGELRGTLAAHRSLLGRRLPMARLPRDGDDRPTEDDIQRQVQVTPVIISLPGGNPAPGSVYGTLTRRPKYSGSHTGTKHAP